MDLIIIDTGPSSNNIGDVLPRIRAAAPKIPLLLVTSDPYVPENVRNQVDRIVVRDDNPVTWVADVEVFMGVN